MILMWSGLLSAIPNGWALCDGQGGRPNLLGRFVMGVSTAETNPGGTGGNNQTILTESQLPSHNHSVSVPAETCQHNLSTSTAANHTHSVYSKNTAGTKRLLWTASNAGEPVTDPVAYSSGSSYKALMFRYTNNPTPFIEPGDNTADKSLLSTSGGSHSHSLTGIISRPAINTTTGSKGSGEGIENRPAYYELAYIIKL